MATKNFKNWYFTFGTDPKFPFHRGWITIQAPTKNKACEIFNILFEPRNDAGLLNCAFVYSEEEFLKTDMANGRYPEEFCHMHYGVSAKEEPVGITKKRILDILTGYIDNDLACAELDYVRDVVESLCNTDEIKELGFHEWLRFGEEDE